MTTDLMPCPFCGAEPIEGSVRDGRVVRCPKCYMSGPPAYHGPENIPSARERVIAAWNTRPSVGVTEEMVTVGLKAYYQTYDEQTGDGAVLPDKVTPRDSMRAALTAALKAKP